MNCLSVDRKVQVLNALLESCSIRAASRLTHTHKNTIIRLMVQSGEHCQILLDRTLHDLPCQTIEADEIWTFVRKKEYRLTEAEAGIGIGDQYTFVALDPLSKLVAAHWVGRRNQRTTDRFVSQLRGRLSGRINLFTDGFQEYETATRGWDIDYAQVIRPKSGDASWGKQLEIVRVRGNPDYNRIGTSYVERNNLTIRQQVRRFTRKTLAFSKKLHNLRAAVALYFAWYNFVRPHGALHGATPAMALGIEPTFWTLERLLPREADVR